MRVRMAGPKTLVLVGTVLIAVGLVLVQAPLGSAPRLDPDSYTFRKLHPLPLEWNGYRKALDVGYMYSSPEQRR